MGKHKEIAVILDQVLGLRSRVSLTPDTALLGNIPELDSLAVVNILTAIEEHFGITIEDDEISADSFATIGTLSTFVEKKLNS